MYDRAKKVSVDVGSFEPLEDRKQPAIEKVVRDKDLSNLVDQYRLERETEKRSASRKKILRDKIIRILKSKGKKQEDGSLIIPEFPNVKALPNKTLDINQDALRSVLLSKNELKNADLEVDILFRAKYEQAIGLLRKINQILGEEIKADIITAIQYPLSDFTKEELNDIGLEMPIGDGYQICIGEEVGE